MDNATRSRIIMMLNQGPESSRSAIALLNSLPRTEADWEPDFYLAMLNSRLNEYGAAVQYLDKSLSLHADNVDALFFRGVFAAELEESIHKRCAIRRDAAKAALDLAQRLGISSSWPHLDQCLKTLAIDATYVGPTKDAEFAYRWLIRLEPHQATHYENLAQLVAENNLVEAVSLLEHAVAIQPKDTLYKDILFARNALEQGKQQAGKKLRSKYPATSEMEGDLKTAVRQCLLSDVPKQPLINAETRIFTLGSCFAREIATRLRQRDFMVDDLEMVEHINSTYANRAMIDWAHGRSHGITRDRLNELFISQKITPESLLTRLKQSAVFIYTLGVAPAFFDRADGAFVMPKTSTLSHQALAELFEFRTTTVAENLDNLEYITAELRKLNPSIRLVITVSPVPLRATFEFESAMQADCVSKSTLRVVANEFVQRHPDVIYWPSFEVVRWLGSHVGPYYGIDDGSSLHIGDEVVHAITDLFIEHYSV